MQEPLRERIKRIEDYSKNKKEQMMAKKDGGSVDLRALDGVW